MSWIPVRDRSAAMLAVLLVALVVLVGVHPARAQLKYWGDFTASFQAIDSDTGPGEHSGAGFTNVRSNLHVFRSLTPGVDGYAEVHLVREGDVELNQGFFTLDDLLKPLKFKLGRFELDYGINHYARTDNAEASGNYFVGNTLVDPFDVQDGVQTTYEGGRFYLRGALTTGKDQAGFSANRAYGKTVQFHHEPWMTFKWGVSFHSADQSLAKESAGFLVDPPDEPYAGLTDGETTTTHVTSPGGGDELETLQLDMSYQMTPTWTITGSLGRIGDDTGPLTSELEYGDLSVQRVLDNDLTLAAQFGLARYDRIRGTSPSGDEVRRLQLAASQPFRENVLVKLEYVNQDVDDGLRSALPTRKPIEFNGFISQLYVSF